MAYVSRITENKVVVKMVYQKILYSYNKRAFSAEKSVEKLTFKY